MPKGVYKRTEEHRKHNREAQNRSEVKEKKSKSAKEVMNRPEIKKKCSKATWKGGSSIYFHNRAQELFAKPFCEECKIDLEEYQKTHKKKRFEMHCISKDYTILEQWNWLCLCSRCHQKEHFRQKKEGIRK